MNHDLIPDKYVRQYEIIPYTATNVPVTIVGVGAIGGCVAVALAKMGFTDLTLIDMDEVEEVNMANQWFDMTQLGKPKAEAMADTIERMTGDRPTVRNERYESGVFPGIVVAALDNMETRAKLWAEHKRIGFSTKLFIDPRMSTEYAVIRTVNMEDRFKTSYEKSLFEDDDGIQERCTAKGTMYTSMLIGGHVAKIVKDYLITGKFTKFVDWNIANNDFISVPSM